MHISLHYVEGALEVSVLGNEDGIFVGEIHVRLLECGLREGGPAMR
jgi:hypothetical protein